MIEISKFFKKKLDLNLFLNVFNWTYIHGSVKHEAWGKKAALLSEIGKSKNKSQISLKKLLHHGFEPKTSR